MTTKGDTTLVALPAAASSGGAPLVVALLVGMLVTLALLVLGLRTRVVIKRRKRRRSRTIKANATVKRHPNRRPNKHLTPNHKPDNAMRGRFHDVTQRDRRR